MSTLFVHGRRLERFAPGLYSDGRGTMHLVVEEFLEGNGYQNTPENREMALDCAREIRGIASMAKAVTPASASALVV